MINVSVTKALLADLVVAGYGLFCPGGELTKEQRALCASLQVPVDQLFERAAFTGSVGSTLNTFALHNGQLVNIIFVGVAKDASSPDEWLEGLRRSVGALARAAEQLKVTDLAIDLPVFPDHGVSPFDGAKEVIATFYMATYHFQQFITDKKRKLPEDYTLVLKTHASYDEELEQGVEWGKRIGHAVCQARQWCDLPAANLTPTELADTAAAIAHAHENLTCTIYNRSEIEKMGMGGVIGVSQGSTQEPRFVVLEYIPENETKDLVALVGKGVTFDSGGLSIKPADRMDEMKDDMAGAAAVIATMQAIAHLKPNVRVVGCTPLVENLPSGSAMKPGDILVHYNGITSEVKNTDAEGRLILADALAYVSATYNPTVIIDAATLTGACAYALGPYFAGLMTQNRELEQRLIAAGRHSGDRLWALPFFDDYKPAIKSDVADVCNIGSSAYRAGAVTAGFFLSHFVPEKMPWAHLDIAGTSFNVPDRSYYRPGATGFGVRLFIELLMNWQTFAS
ncbi:MAG: leucyl aminopeptidase [Candidatus Babeliaceae bacterium]|nr:leucyl aminopeptidase [Candidatus Babeliaceae bacterium]